MSRILAIDYGKKRVGIAVTDPLKIIATGLGTIDTLNIFHFLKDYVIKENVACIVVGDPIHLNGTSSEMSEIINKFILELQKVFPEIKITGYDERFTSKMAFQAMLEGGLKRKDRQKKEKIDEISAVILLQSYMESIS